MKLNILVIIFFAALLAGCSSMSKNECVNADWQLVGFEDGANGEVAGKIGERREACAKHGVTPDRRAYQAGYQDGLRTFCTFDQGQTDGEFGYRSNSVCADFASYFDGYQLGIKGYCTYDIGYREGETGEEYLRVCSGAAESEFLAGYEEGREIYKHRHAYRRIQRHIGDVLYEQESNDDEITELQKDIVLDTELTVAERVALLADIKRLSDRNQALERELATLEIELEAAGRELDQLGVSRP